MRLVVAALAVLSSSFALSARAAPPAPVPFPDDRECTPLPAAHPPFSFGPGEQLEFDLDALGAQAGKLFMAVKPIKDGLMPIEVSAKTNTLFSKVRRVSGGGTTYLNPRTLRPLRYVEDTTEDELHKTAQVLFRPKDHGVTVDWTYGVRSGHSEFRYASDGLDLAGAIYAIRQLPLRANTHVCFDVYGIRRLWRVVGKVEAREHVSLPAGEFDAWHLSGMAIRTDDHRVHREIHVWISDDPRRLPLVALGMIDLGAVRATLSAFRRPGEKPVRAAGQESLKW